MKSPTNSKDKSTLKILDFLRQQTPEEESPLDEEEAEDIAPPAPLPGIEEELPLTRPPTRTKLFSR